MGETSAEKSGKEKLRSELWVTACTEFMWHGFGSERAAGLASVRRCQNLPQYQTDPMPAERSSDSGSTSMITYFKKGKKKR